MRTAFFHQHGWAAPLLVGTIVCLAHLQAPGALEFHYDDGHSLVRNPHLRDLGLLPDFFLSASYFGENPDDRMYRPLVLVAHSLNLQLDGLSPGPFVAVNLLLHAITAGIVTWWLAGWLRLLPSLAGGLLFGLHPLQSEVVHYVSARSESMAGLFVMLSVGAFVRARQTPAASAHDGSSTGGWARIWAALSVGFAALALLCKSTAVVTPALIFIAAQRPGTGLSADLRSTLRLCWPYVLLSSIYIILYQSLRSPDLSEPVRSMGTQLLTQSKAIIYYCTQAVMPVRLSILPQFSESSHAEPAVTLALLAIASLAAVTVKLMPAGPWRGVGWFLACLSPTLLVPLNVLVNDHRTYLALAGGVLLLADLVVRRSPRRWIAAIVGVFFILSWQRSAAWQTEARIWQDAVAKGPAMAIAHYNLGFAQHIAGQPDSAASHYEAALRLDAEYVRPLNNLGALYKERGDFGRAIPLLRRAVDLEPDRVESLNNLAATLTASGRPRDALPILARAARLAPQQAEIWLNLGLAQRDTGDRAAAAQSLQRALRLDPGLRRRLGPGP